MQMDNDGTIVVSMADIIQHPHFNMIQKKYLNEEGEIQEGWVEECLRAMGLDTKKHYESSIRIHTAPICGQMITCERFYGSERRDRDWVDFKEAQESFFINQELDERFKGRFRKE